MDRTCGGCTMCCKSLGVVELAKPKDEWCPHCDIGRGCKIYPDRPPTCREFLCVWRRDNSTMPDELRPDRCKVVLDVNDDGDSIVAHEDPKNPGSAEKGLIGTFLEKIATAGIMVVVISGDMRKILYNSSKVSPEIRAKLKQMEARYR